LAAEIEAPGGVNGSHRLVDALRRVTAAVMYLWQGQ
jgi:hypothetical protein